MSLTSKSPLYALETYGELQPAMSQEWLLTNGIGGFASSSVAGCNRRRYHGLLVAAVAPPVGRVNTLSRVGEIVRVDDGGVHELAVNQFGQSFHPRGDRYLRRFELFHTARWEYEVEGTKIVKELTVLWKRNVTVLRYTIDPQTRGRAELSLLPFVALRDFHALRRGQAEMKVEHAARQVSVRNHDLTLHLSVDGGEWVEHPDWWTGHTFSVETERGQDDTEDLFNPGRFVVTTEKPTTVTFVASVEGAEAAEGIDWDAELARRAAAFPSAPSLSRTVQRLRRAAFDFIVDRKCPDGSMGSTVLAGYPWFADWGRDTMISLPGLFLTTGRHHEAAQVLSLFAEYVSEGMIPNVFNDYTNEPDYNTVDASLWYVHAAHEYLRVTGDRKTYDNVLRPACDKIIDGYKNGTRFGIRMDPDDGLIEQGDANTQLTWMDARCNGVAFTPRQGKPVEINALWYNALMLTDRTELAATVRENFTKAFWVSPFRGLNDVVEGPNYARRDNQIRPNQIFAVSLTHSPLTPEQQHAVVEVVRRELLTPVGLRTLAPGEKNFFRYYRGNQFSRDGAYHNGAIWPWLIGGFLDAYLKVNRGSEKSIAQAREWLRPLVDQLATGCIGQVAEIFEAEPPHREVGCCAQAWSVAEVLRLAIRLEM